MDGKSQLRFALAAAVAGLAWGYVRHRRDARAFVFAALQGLEWFVAYGGAAALVDRARQSLEGDENGGDYDEFERITHIRQAVDERTGTEG